MKWLTIVLLITSVFGTSIARAAPTCEDVIRTCDKALFDKEKVITLGDLALEQRKAQVEMLTRQVAEKDAALNSPLRNPWFILAIGLVAGGLIAK